MNTIADLASAAGIIDGEGSIFIMKQQRKDRERGHNYILRISVQSTDPYMTKELGKLFPEGAIFSQNRYQSENWSDTLKWQVSGRRAVNVLKQILSFMRVKQDQAKMAVDFQETTKKHWRHMTTLDYDTQEAFYYSLKQAKQDLKIGKSNS